MILGAVRLCILFQLPARLLDKGVSLMASKPNTKERRHKQQSITRKIIIKMAILIIVLFGLSVIIAALLSSRSLKKVTNEKLVLTAYENAYTLSNNIESSYLGFAGSLRNISALPPAFQRQAIDTALVGILQQNDKFTTAFAYFEQNRIADAQGKPMRKPTGILPMKL